MASLGGAIVSASPASAAPYAVREDVHLRGIGGNCLTARSVTSLNVSMRRCDPTNTLQNWDVLNWNDGFGQGNGLALANTQRCLGEIGAIGSFVNVGLIPCNPSSEPSTQWISSTLQSAIPDGPQKIQSFFDRTKCLDVAYAGTAQDTPVWLYGCNNQSGAQDWLVGKAKYVAPVAGLGSKCMTSTSSIPARTSELSISTCDGSDRQRWALVNNYLTLGGMCLDIRGASLASGTAVQMWNCVNVPQQRWVEQSNGSLKSALGSVCLDVAGGSSANGTRVWSWACNSTYAQGWYLGAVPTSFMQTQSGATQLNAAISARIVSCTSMVHFKVDNVHVVAMKNPAALLVRRSSGLFTDAAKAAGVGAWANRAAINGQWFSYSGAGALQPQGDIWYDGQKVATNPFPAYQGYYVTVPSSGSCSSPWRIGPQDNRQQGAAPPAPSNFAMGGARPLVVNGQKWGRSNEPHLKWPSTLAESFDSYDAIAGVAINGKTTLGVRGDGVVMMMVQENLSLGRRLSEVRDAYALLGFRDAVLFDPNSSATLAVNGAVQAAPDLAKDQRIPFGLGMATR